MAALFAKLQARYLHKWTSAIEGIEGQVAAEWSEQLAGLTADQIKRGLDSWKEGWPPSAPEFREACLGKRANEYGLDYVPEYYREENRITDRSRLLSSADRDAQRVKNREHVKAMKLALRGCA